MASQSRKIFAHYHPPASEELSLITDYLTGVTSMAIAFDIEQEYSIRTTHKLGDGLGM